MAERISSEVLEIKIAGFLQRHDLLYDHLERFHINYEFDEEFFDFLDWANNTLGDEPSLPHLSADEAMASLKRAGWDIKARHPAKFQLRNLTAAI